MTRRPALVVSLVTSCCCVAQQHSLPERQQVEQQGVRVEFSLADRDAAAGTALARVRVTDAVSGVPLEGELPRVWLNRRLNEQVANERDCDTKIRGFASGQLGLLADVDLNGYLFATLNEDKTVVFLNPFVASTSKMEAAVELRERGFDWAYVPRLEKIFISMPDAAAVAVIDAVTLKQLPEIALKPSGRPGRIQVAPDGETLWVGVDDAAAVAVIDGRAGTMRGEVPVGRGLHQVAFSTAERAYVTNSLDNTVTVIDTRSLLPVAEVRVGQTPVGIAYVPLAKMVYVANLNGETISAIAAGSNAVVKQIPSARGNVAIGATADGRYVAALNQTHHEIMLFDSSSNAVAGRAAVADQPVQMAFTDDFVYAYSPSVERITLVELKALRAGMARASQVQVGAGRAGKAEPPAVAAQALAPTPEGNAVVIADAADAVLYFYEEGAMAPGGTVGNDRRQPLGVMIVDRSLKRVGKGEYAAPMHVRAGGRYDVSIALNQPRLRQCLTTTFASPDRGAATSQRVTLQAVLLTPAVALPAETHTKLTFRMLDKSNGTAAGNVSGLQLVVTEPHGAWQARSWLMTTGDGRYEASQSFPHAGTFNLNVVSINPAFVLQHTVVNLTVVDALPASARKGM